VELAEVRGQLEQLTARDAALARRDRVITLLQEYELPLPDSRSDAARQVVSDQFVESLMKAADDQTVRRLIEERAALVQSATRWTTAKGRSAARPVSRDQGAVAFAAGGHRAVDAKEFATAVCGR
jgi:DNA-binding GntR family transcriptional regulator